MADSVAPPVAPETKFPLVEGNHQGKPYQLRKRLGRGGKMSPFWYVNFEAGGEVGRVFQSTGTTSVAAAHLVAKKKVAAALAGRWAPLEATKLRQEVATIGELIKAFENGMAARSKVGTRATGGYVSALRSVIRTVHGDGAGLEAMRSTALTRELLMKFKEARWPKSGSVGDEERAVTTINSTIKQARALFSKRARELYKDLGLKVPDLTGFLGVSLFKDERDVSFRPIHPKMLAEMDAAAWALLREDPERARKREDGTTDDRLVPARPDVFLAYMMARFLGMRDIEIVAARWDWLEHWQDGWRMAIVKRDYFRPKHGEGRVPIAPELHTLLQERGDRDSLWIVPATSKTAREVTVYRDANFFLRQWLPDREKGMHELRKQAGSEVYTQTKSLSLAAEFLRNSEETCRKHYAKLLVPPPALRFAVPSVPKVA